MSTIESNNHPLQAIPQVEATQARYPGSQTLIRTVSQPYPTAAGAQDALTDISALAGFVFGYVDEQNRTVSFHRDPLSTVEKADDVARVFAWSRDTQVD